MRTRGQSNPSPGLLLLAVGLWLAGAAQAKTLYVPAGKPTIQAAINAAAGGDVVVVARGTYHECLDFLGKAITVKSSQPQNQTVRAATIIDGGGQGSVVTFQSGEKGTSVLTGFTLTNGSQYNGGGVSCSNGSSPTITYNLISGNTTASNGGGLRCEGASPTVTDNVIQNNTAGQGGGVACDNESSPRLSRNTISGNTAELGGGVFCSFSSSPTLVGNLICGNFATTTLSMYHGGGGGLFCTHAASPRLTNCTIAHNAGGGVYPENGSSPVLKNTIVAFNTGGAGLYVGDPFEGAPRPVITYCDFYGNSGGNYVNWPGQAGKRGNICKNPLFAYPSRGNYYEKSRGGRWNPATKAWVLDSVQSPCINAGDPASPCGKEPAPNGGRVNMGAYGNTIHASKSAPATAATGLLAGASATPTSGGGAQFTVSLRGSAEVAVTITNLAGRDVATLPARTLSGGISTLAWNGRSARGLRVPAGTYLARLSARGAEGERNEAVVKVALW